LNLFWELLTATHLALNNLISFLNYRFISIEIDKFLSNLFSFLEGLHVFHIGKRNPPFQHWEPIYIGSHNDPLYDERLSWEGRSDKMTQVYFIREMDKLTLLRR